MKIDLTKPKHRAMTIWIPLWINTTVAILSNFADVFKWCLPLSLGLVFYACHRVKKFDEEHARKMEALREQEELERYNERINRLNEEIEAKRRKERLKNFESFYDHEL